MIRTSTRAAACAAALGFAVAFAAPATAHEGDDERRGNCSRNSEWRLKAKPDDGRIEVEGRVDSDHHGQTWKWRILHDGDVSYRGRKHTTGSGGYFEIERRIVDAPGKDHIGWRAVNPRSHETCRGSITV